MFVQRHNKHGLYLGQILWETGGLGATGRESVEGAWVLRAEQEGFRSLTYSGDSKTGSGCYHYHLVLKAVWYLSTSCCCKSNSVGLFLLLGHRFHGGREQFWHSSYIGTQGWCPSHPPLATVLCLSIFFKALLKKNNFRCGCALWEFFLLLLWHTHLFFIIAPCVAQSHFRCPKTWCYLITLWGDCQLFFHDDVWVPSPELAFMSLWDSFQKCSFPLYINWDTVSLYHKDHQTDYLVG